MNGNRIISVDYAKAIGIYLVVLAHTQLCAPLTNWIYVFHMPLFFFISGYLFSFEKHTSFKEFSILRFRQLIVPYIAFNVISYLAWLLVLCKVGVNDDSNISWYEPILAALQGKGYDMVHNVPLWFFMCLYIVEMIYYCLFRNIDNNKRCIMIAVIAVIGFISGKIDGYFLPLCLSIVPSAILFYSLGNMFNGKILKTNKLLIMFFLVITVVVAHFNGRINMHRNFYGNYILFVLGAFSGIYMMIGLCNLFAAKSRNHRLAKYISMNTLIICGFHLLVFSFIKFIMVYVLNINPNILADSILGNILFACFSIVVCVPIIYIIKKYIPFIIGKR